jgi:hypothetical protein
MAGVRSNRPPTDRNHRTGAMGGFVMHVGRRIGLAISNMLGLVLVARLAVAGVAEAAPISIDFEEYPTCTQICNRYATSSLIPEATFETPVRAGFSERTSAVYGPGQVNNPDASSDSQPLELGHGKYVLTVSLRVAHMPASNWLSIAAAVLQCRHSVAVAKPAQLIGRHAEERKAEPVAAWDVEARALTTADSHAGDDSARRNARCSPPRHQP